MKKQVSRCDRKSGRGKTTDFEREDFSYITDDWVLPTGQGVKKAYQALFWQHARWAREEFYWNCPIIGMRVVSFFYLRNSFFKKKISIFNISSNCIMKIVHFIVEKISTF